MNGGGGGNRTRVPRYPGDGFYVRRSLFDLATNASNDQDAPQPVRLFLTAGGPSSRTQPACYMASPAPTGSGPLT